MTTMTKDKETETDNRAKNTAIACFGYIKAGMVNYGKVKIPIRAT